LVQKEKNPVYSKNIMREYLQAKILGAIQRTGAMIPLAFHGGTALRFLFHLPRYSEDLDFTLEYPEAKYHFNRLLKSIKNELTKEGYMLSIKMNDSKIIHSAFINFSDLLYEAGLSPHQDEKFSVKIEIDTHPPKGVVLQKTIIRRHVTLHLQHHDCASMLAGKLV
jgi:hypothetical protein